MAKDYRAITSEIAAQLGKMHKELPGVMQGFNDMARGATQEAVLSTKTKELIAIALAVAARCDGCIGFHAKALVKLGVSREELMETLGMAVYMGGGPSLMYAAETLEAYDQFLRSA